MYPIGIRLNPYHRTTSRPQFGVRRGGGSPAKPSGEDEPLGVRFLVRMFATGFYDDIEAGNRPFKKMSQDEFDRRLQYASEFTLDGVNDSDKAIILNALVAFGFVEPSSPGTTEAQSCPTQVEFERRFYERYGN